MVLVGQREHAARLPCAADARPPDLVVGDGDDQVRGVDDVEPPMQLGAGQVEATVCHVQPELRVGTEHDEEVAGLGVPGDELGSAHGRSPLTGQVGGGDQPAQAAPTGPVRGGRDDTRQPRVADLAAPGRGATARRGGTAGAPRIVRTEGHCQVDADDRRDAGTQACLGEPDGAVEPVTVGQPEGVHVERRGGGDELLGVRGPVLERVARGHPKVDEGVIHGVGRLSR